MEAVVSLAELVVAALLALDVLAVDVLAAALWLLVVGGRGRKVVVPIELGPPLFLLDLARAAAGSTSRGHKDGAGGGTCMLVAIDEATSVALGWGLGLRGVGTNTGRLPETTADDCGGAFSIGMGQGGRVEVGVSEMVKGDHGGVEDGGARR